MNNVDRDMAIVRRKARALRSQDLVGDMATVVREQFAAAIKPLIERLRTCERRLAEMEHDRHGGA